MERTQQGIATLLEWSSGVVINCMLILFWCKIELRKLPEFHESFFLQRLIRERYRLLTEAYGYYTHQHLLHPRRVCVMAILSPPLYCPLALTLPDLFSPPLSFFLSFLMVLPTGSCFVGRKLFFPSSSPPSRCPSLLINDKVPLPLMLSRTESPSQQRKRGADYSVTESRVETNGSSS